MTSKTSTSYSEQTRAFSSQESSLTSSTKYGGLITLSFSKQVRNALVVLNSHFDQTVPFRFLMHSIVAFFRFLQLLFPAFLLNDDILFTQGSAAKNTSHYLSILHRFVPIGLPIQNLTWALYCYSAIAAIFDIAFLVSGLIFRQTAKIPDIVSNIFSILISVLCNLLQPFGASLLGEVIGHMVFDSHDDITNPIIAGIFSIIIMVIYFMLESHVFVHSVIFKPDSVPFVSGSNSIFFSLMVVLINLTYTFAIKCTIIPKLILLLVGICEYVVGIILIPRGASFVKISQFKLFYGLCFSGILATMLNIVVLALNRKGDMILIIVDIGIILVGLMLSSILFHRKIVSSLSTLDEMSENNSGSLENFNITKFVHLCVIGCHTGHPYCTSFKAFEEGLEQWPNSIDLLLVYAKFIAIYPDCTKKLSVILGRLKAHGLKSMAAKQYMHQIMSIIDQRENVVSLSLKKKMNQAQKKINSAKRKVQNIWDYIIQSNFQELGPAVNSCYSAVNTAEADLIKLRNAFPNNTFVARIYLRFMLDIRHDLTKVNEEYDKIAKLRKGILVVLDRASELGTLQFPQMPITVNQGMERTQTMEFTSESEIGIEEENSEADIDANKLLMDKISKMSLPAINKTIAIVTILSLIVVIIPIILLMSLNSIYVDTVLEPIGYMTSVALMRSLVFQVSACIIRIALEELPDVKMVSNFPVDYYPVYLNNSHRTRDYLTTFVGKIGSATSNANQIRDYMIGNTNMDQARKILFTNSIDYKYYKNDVDYKDVKMSGVNILLDVAMLGARISATPVMDISTISTVEFMNPRMNAEETGKRLSEVLTIFVDYVRIQCQMVKQIILYIQIVYSCIVAVLYIAITWYSIKHVQTETNEVYVSLTLLPKAAVSHAADSIRILRKDTTTPSNNTESSGIENSNKQEETIIKVFMSANENSSGNTVMNAIEIAATVMILQAGLIAINIMANLYSNQYDIFQTSAPHSNYIMGASAYIYASMISLNAIALTQSYPPLVDDPKIHVPRFTERIGLFRNFYNQMRYGGSSSLESPFVGFEKGVQSADEMYMCDDKMLAPSDFIAAFSCYDIESQFILFAIIARRVSFPFIEAKINMNFQGTLDKYEDLTTENEYLNSLWTLGPVMIYDTFVCPLVNVLEESIETEMIEAMSTPLVTSAIMIVVVIAMLITIVIVNQEIMRRVRFFFSLILHINTSTILATNKIMSILNGEILGSNIDVSSRNDVFYEEVVQKHINGLIATDETKKIISVNQMIVNNFNVTEEELIGQDLTCFFNSEMFDNADSFFVGGKCVEEITLNHNGTYYKCITKSAKTTLIIVLKDVTATINHEKLISEERAKSDMMLSSILPAALVPRVQSGETNISFAVQSASVLFLDIVSFTPWCGSNKAAYIMKVLNMLFKNLDAELKEFPTMTKIKCIGDCYMAAGGIFDEVNQPAVHAKQCVEFGLKAIEVIENLNKELGEKLQIRVGINSGGPLVAGVIGTGKPTFEIIGPCINMAQQMEHHGVPMQVHVSRSTYELIYGGSFNIKERGIVEVKNGKVNTYLVTN